ncbi:MAG TPA: DUF167 domain-containing protein [Nitrospira sp.]|nr:DUF167 domain-containing protein [Nitrospira sp.]
MDVLPVIARDSERGVLLTVHTQPNASRTECVGVHGDAIKIRVAARPIQGAANEELVRFIADRCSLARTQVQILGGAETRRKRLCVQGVTAEILMARLLPPDSKGMMKT